MGVRGDFDWSFGGTPLVTNTSIILSSNKIQNGDILDWYRLTQVVLENRH